jgi:hypothetical protein
MHLLLIIQYCFIKLMLFYGLFLIITLMSFSNFPIIINNLSYFIIKCYSLMSIIIFNWHPICLIPNDVFPFKPFSIPFPIDSIYLINHISLIVSLVSQPKLKQTPLLPLILYFLLLIFLLAYQTLFFVHCLLLFSKIYHSFLLIRLYFYLQN